MQGVIRPSETNELVVNSFHENEKKRKEVSVMNLHEYSTTKWTRRVLASTLALALASFATYEWVKPAAASAAVVAPAAGPLSDDSVGALLAVDRAMETLAARVTPAVVNVAVTSRSKPDADPQQLPQDMQRFFGQGNPFGQGFGK